MNPLVQKAHQQTRKIDEESRRFFEQVNSVMSWVPAPLDYLVDPIVRNLALLDGRLREFQDRVNQLWDQRGDSDRLKQVGEQWVSQVGNALGDIAGTIGLDKLRTTIEWEGRAARAYQATVPPQAAGLNSIKDIAGQMRSSLNSLANSIDMFWIAMGLAFVGFAVAIAGAVVAAFTVVGIPAAIGVILTAAAAAFGLIAAAIMALESHINTIEVEQAAIRQKLRDLGSTWTMPNTADMADASATDGDGSDWRPGS
ncbi:hypothetical protein LZG04_34240 [Saccharothrix sp. S26]|uniref:hypothetical protein n=1 Tax=Saccharothrix sp. S26 TaxID=2907215 RepID=UPI001F441691|nr:hypothetical protein [Saccharothrix sp. S26]MCE6999837.1 hypothetical protein [Saccharothrix sp. S26]